MPVTRRSAEPLVTPTVSQDTLRKSPFTTVHEAADYLKESKRVVRELVNKGAFRLVPNSNGTKKPWRLLWAEIEVHAAKQIQKAA